MYYTLHRTVIQMVNVRVGAIISLVIGVILIANTFPSAIEELYDADTANWTIGGVEDTKATAIWWLLPMIVVVGGLYMLLRNAGVG